RCADGKRRLLVDHCGLRAGRKRRGSPGRRGDGKDLNHAPNSSHQSESVRSEAACTNLTGPVMSDGRHVSPSIRICFPPASPPSIEAVTRTEWQSLTGG